MAATYQKMKVRRRWGMLWLLLGALLVWVGAYYWSFVYRANSPPIKIGVLHSLSGTMAQSERPLVDAMQLAVEQINASGGLLDLKVEPVIADCRSDADFCAQEAERLITREHVSALFGCWTSACRKAVKRVVEKHEHLLFYPLQYEGMEESQNIVYLGAAPNQQLIPAVRWALDQLGKTFYLVGSDYVFPRTANLIMKDIILSQGGEIIAERYLPLGSQDVTSIVAEIKKLHPAVVLNTINGDSNNAFFAAMAQAGMKASDSAVISFSIAESEVAAIVGVEGHYAAWSYFQSLQSAENQMFVDAFQHRFGKARVISDPMETAYNAVGIWARAVRDAHSDSTAAVNAELSHLSLRTPGGIVALDEETRHAWRVARIGRVRPDKQFDIVWESQFPIKPEPFPTYRKRADWNSVLAGEKQR